MFVQNRPVVPTTPRVYAQPTGSGLAPQPISVAVNNYQPASTGNVSYQTASTGSVSIMATLSSMFGNLIAFVKGLFGKLFGGTSTPATPATPATTGAAPSDAALVAQFGLLNTPQNVAAFRQVLATEQADPSVIGPGSTNTESVTELQQLLDQWGYQVPVTGQFDQATASAVMTFKSTNGLTESFAFANGQPGVTPFIDQRTRAKMVALLQSNQTPTTTTSVPTTPVSTTPVSTTPAPATSTGLSADQLAVCQQQGILATPANFTAFMTVAQALEQQNALGPGSTDTTSIKELQQVLAGWGYSVQANGQWDQATTNAVLQYKKANGLQSSYVLADGTPGYNPFIDAATKQAMIKKLGG